MCKIGFKRDAIDFKLKDTQDNPYLTKNRFRYAILEKVDASAFDKFENVDLNQLSCWDKGRCFGETAELKWQNRNGNFHFVVITDEPALPKDFQELCGNLRKIEYKNAQGNPKAREIFLWGEKDRSKGVEGWFEARIPRIFKYPVDFSAPKKRVKLMIQEYELEEIHPEREDPFPSTVYRFVRLAQDIEED